MHIIYYMLHYICILYIELVQLDQGEVGAYYILYVTLYISYIEEVQQHQEKNILIVNRLLISFQHDQLQETHETQNAARGGE